MGKKTVLALILVLLLVAGAYQTGLLGDLLGKLSQPPATGTAQEDQAGQDSGTGDQAADGGGEAPASGAGSGGLELEGVWRGVLNGTQGYEGTLNATLVVGSLGGSPAALLFVENLANRTPFLLDAIEESGDTATLRADGYALVELVVSQSGDALEGTLTVDMRNLSTNSVVIVFNVSLERSQGEDPADLLSGDPGMLARNAGMYPLNGTPASIVENLARAVGDLLGAGELTVQSFNASTSNGTSRATAFYTATGVDYELYSGASSLLFYLNLAGLLEEYNYTLMFPPDHVTYSLLGSMGGTVSLMACNPGTSTTVMLLLDLYNGYLEMQVAASDDPAACQLVGQLLEEIS